MEDKIEKLLDLMAEIVNDTTTPWRAKSDLIKSKVASGEYWETAFEEFISWFPDEAG